MATAYCCRCSIAPVTGVKLCDHCKIIIDKWLGLHGAHEHHCVDCEREIICDLLGCEDDSHWRCIDCFEGYLDDVFAKLKVHPGQRIH